MQTIKTYKKILPALQTRVSEFKLFGIDYITERDIFNYLDEEVWNSEEISIDELLSDVLNTPTYLIKDYLLNKHKNSPKNLL